MQDPLLVNNLSAYTLGGRKGRVWGMLTPDQSLCTAKPGKSRSTANSPVLKQLISFSMNNVVHSPVCGRHLPFNKGPKLNSEVLNIQSTALVRGNVSAFSYLDH